MQSCRILFLSDLFFSNGCFYNHFFSLIFVVAIFISMFLFVKLAIHREWTEVAISREQTEENKLQEDEGWQKQSQTHKVSHKDSQFCLRKRRNRQKEKNTKQEKMSNKNTKIETGRPSWGRKAISFSFVLKHQVEFVKCYFRHLEKVAKNLLKLNAISAGKSSFFTYNLVWPSLWLLGSSLSELLS